MPKFIGIHTLPAGGITAEQLNQLATAAQNDPVVRGYRSFVNLSEGKAVCVMEAPSKDDVVSWFKKMQMPTDSVTPVEYEGECGAIQRV